MRNIKIIIIIIAFLALYIPVNAAGAPSIISYQGRLANSSGSVLGGSGTTYYFKFSIWDNATVGSGSRVWPTSAPGSTSVTVRNGIFSVNIGDTTNGYPDTLDYDFGTNESIFLQVEVSSDDSTFETVSPRQQITSVPFAQLAESVVFDNGFKLEEVDSETVRLYDSTGETIFEFDESQ